MFIAATLKERHPEAFVEVDHPVAGKLHLAGAPTLFSESKVDLSRAAPSLGAHNREILTMLGYSNQQQEEFKTKGII